MIQLHPKANWKEFQAPGGNIATPGGRWYCWGHLAVCVGDPKVEGCHHISISHPFRYPTWDEIHAARYYFLPEDIDCAIFLPKKSEYVNLHPNCFHVWEVKDAEIPARMILP